jgi:hypothetical protein
MTLRSLPDFRPIVVRCSAPQPRLLAVVHRKRPPLRWYTARCACQNARMNHRGGSLGGRVVAVLVVRPLLVHRQARPESSGVQAVDDQ